MRKMSFVSVRALMVLGLVFSGTAKASEAEVIQSLPQIEASVDSIVAISIQGGAKEQLKLRLAIETDICPSQKVFTHSLQRLGPGVRRLNLSEVATQAKLACPPSQSSTLTTRFVDVVLQPEFANNSKSSEVILIPTEIETNPRKGISSPNFFRLTISSDGQTGRIEAYSVRDPMGARNDQPTRVLRYQRMAH